MSNLSELDIRQLTFGLGLWVGNLSQHLSVENKKILISELRVLADALEKADLGGVVHPQNLHVDLNP